MDAITHVLAGACIARAVLNRKTVLGTLTVILAAEAPDLDMLARLRGPVAGFVHERGFTHSIAGVGLVSLALTCFMYVIWRFVERKKKGFPVRWYSLLGLSYLAGLSHTLLDFTDSYGVRPYILALFRQMVFVGHRQLCRPYRHFIPIRRTSAISAGWPDERGI